MCAKAHTFRKARADFSKSSASCCCACCSLDVLAMRGMLHLPRAGFACVHPYSAACRVSEHSSANPPTLGAPIAFGLRVASSTARCERLWRGKVGGGTSVQEANLAVAGRGVVMLHRHGRDLCRGAQLRPALTALLLLLSLLMLPPPLHETRHPVPNALRPCRRWRCVEKLCDHVRIHCELHVARCACI